ncbi:MAG: hypothetical protein K0Q73_5303 [Paenibacillus sp.]|nr:hypothetical protein [Paenibacillus sp.]
MINCPFCNKLTEIQKQHCSHCGKVLNLTIAQKFDILAESVEKALKKELETRRKRKGSGLSGG